MIVVIGALGLRGSREEPEPDGLAPAIACAAAATGARVELISKAGDDPAGDAVLLTLAQAGVGHVATLRDPSRHTPVRTRPPEPTDPAVEDGTGPVADGTASSGSGSDSSGPGSGDDRTAEPTDDSSGPGSGGDSSGPG